MNKFNIYSPDGQFLVATVKAEKVLLRGDNVTGTNGEGELAKIVFVLSPVGMVIDADRIVGVEAPESIEASEPIQVSEPIDGAEPNLDARYPTVYNPNSIDLTKVLEVGDDVIAYGDEAKITSLEGDEVYTIGASTGYSYTRFGAYQKTQPSPERDLKPVGFDTWDEYVEAKKMNSVE